MVNFLQDKGDPNRKLFAMAPFPRSVCEVPEDLVFRRTAHTSVLDVQRRDRGTLMPRYPTRRRHVCMDTLSQERREMHLSERPHIVSNVWGFSLKSGLPKHS